MGALARGVLFVPLRWDHAAAGSALIPREKTSLALLSTFRCSRRMLRTQFHLRRGPQGYQTNFQIAVWSISVPIMSTGFSLSIPRHFLGRNNSQGCIEDY